MATQEELEFQALLNQAMAGSGQAPTGMPEQAVDPVRAERLAFEASQAAPVAPVNRFAAPVASPSAEQIMLRQQDAIRQNSLAQRTQAAETAQSIAQRPRQRFLREGEGFMDAFKNPGAGQRQFAINAGLSLLSSGGTQDLSQRIGHALGAGVQGMQTARQGELDVASQAAKAKQAALAGEGQGLAQEVAFSRDIGSLRESQAQQAKNEAAGALAREKFEFDKQKQPYVPDVMTKRQERRRDLQESLTTLTDPAAIEQVNQEIFELNSALSPKAYFDPSRNVMVQPSGRSSKPTQFTKQTIDLLGSISGASQIASEGMGLIYNRTQEKVFGKLQNIPFLGAANQTARALLNQEVSTFLEAKERYSINAMLPFARTLAPVTEIDTKMLQRTKGMLEKSDINAQIREFETKALPDLARMIFDSNMAYKVGDAEGAEGQVYGPQVAAQNQLIFAESSLNGALQGQGYTADQSMAEKNERTNRLLDMYPSTGVSRNISGADGVYSYKGKVVSQNFIDKISKGYGLTPADFIKYSEISAY